MRILFDADEFMRQHGDWAKWSDCRDMIEAAFATGVAAERERYEADLADACIVSEIPDSKYESLCIALRGKVNEENV